MSAPYWLILSYFWHSEDGLVFNDFSSPNPVVIAPEITEQTEYNFILTVYDAEAYSEPDTVAVTVINVTSIESPSDLSDNRIVIYPNPASQQITIQSEETITEIQILDISAKAIQTENPKSMNIKLDSSTLPPGVYFIRLQTQSGYTIKKLLIN